MITGTSYFESSAFISNFYRANGWALSDNLTHAASGKRVLQPKDNTGDYFRADRITRENRVNQIFLRDIVEAKGMVATAEKEGTFVFETITEMKAIAKRYWEYTGSDEERDALKAEFESLKTEVIGTIDSGYYSGKKLVADSSASPLYTVTLNSYNFNDKLQITFDSNDVADVGGLAIDLPDEATVMAAIEAERSKAGSYLAKASSYSNELDAHYGLIDQKMQTNETFKSEIANTDEGREITMIVQRGIRQQMSVAMMAQANMFRSGVASLVNMD